MALNPRTSLAYKGRARTMATDEDGPYVIGVTGASGAPIAVSVLRGLRAAQVPVALVVSAGAVPVIAEECGMPAADLHPMATDVYADTELGAPIASGSRRTRGMAIVPCSSSTLAKVGVGISDTLITRAAHVHLKERRPLVLVPRETPLSTLQLRHMTTLSELGATILVAAPPFYTHPRSVADQVDFLAGKVLDHLGVRHTLYRGWKEPAR